MYWYCRYCTSVLFTLFLLLFPLAFHFHFLVVSFHPSSYSCSLFIAGVGFGAYCAVDFALVMDVLPEDKDKAKDLAVWHQVGKDYPLVIFNMNNRVNNLPLKLFILARLHSPCKLSSVS